MSNKLARETDNTGNPKYWQTESGHIIYSINNQPQCSYCGIPSHGRDNCSSDERAGIFCIHHPQQGNLQSRNKMLNRPATRTTPKDKSKLTRLREHNNQTIASPLTNINRLPTINHPHHTDHTAANHRIQHTQERVRDRTIPTTGLTNMPSEVMQSIMSYLTFKEITRLQRVNRRMKHLATTRLPQ